jgi:excisionase family DNA binding protein
MMRPRNRRIGPPISLATAPAALKVSQVAAILQVSIDTVYDLIHQKRLPAHNMGTKQKARWRIPKVQLLRVLEGEPAWSAADAEQDADEEHARRPRRKAELIEGPWKFPAKRRRR